MKLDTPISSKTEGAETARRALRVLEALATHGPGAGLDDVAVAVGLSKSTAYRLLRVLQEEGYADRDPTGGYRLGPRMAGLAAAALPELDCYVAIKPILRELALASGETTTFHRRAGDLGLLVLAAESEKHMLRRAALIGEASPLYRGASGLAILSDLPGPVVEEILARHGQKTGLVAKAKELGYATSLGANHPGVAGIAVPVAGTASSIAVSGPVERWTEEHMLSFAATLREGSAQIAELLQKGTRS